MYLPKAMYVKNLLLTVLCKRYQNFNVTCSRSLHQIINDDSFLALGPHLSPWGIKKIDGPTIKEDQEYRSELMKNVESWIVYMALKCTGIGITFLVSFSRQWSPQILVLLFQRARRVTRPKIIFVILATTQRKIKSVVQTCDKYVETFVKTL